MEIRNSSKVRIFKYVETDGKIKYTVGIGKKLENGQYENAFYPIQFNKDVELEYKQDIMIKNAWLSFYNWEFEGKKGTSFFIKCSQFDLVNDTEPKLEEIKEEVKDSGQISEDVFSDFANEIEIESPF